MRVPSYLALFMISVLLAACSAGRDDSPFRHGDYSSAVTYGKSSADYNVRYMASGELLYR